MQPRTVFTAILVLALASAPGFAAGQSCADALRPVTFGSGGAVVSTLELAIPQKAWQHLEHARLAMARNDEDAFSRELGRALLAEPRFAQAYLLRALHFTHTGQFAAARDAAITARAIEPGLHRLGTVLAGAQIQLGEYDDALATLQAVPEDEATGWEVSYERARAELALHHLNEALHWSDLAVRLAPVGCTQARLVRANVLRVTGHREEAMLQLRTYLTEDRQGVRHGEVLLALEAANQDQRNGPQATMEAPRTDDRVSAAAGTSARRGTGFRGLP